MELLQLIPSELILALLGVIMAGGGWLFKIVASWLGAKAKSEGQKALLDRLMFLSKIVVKDLYQRIVKALKEEGSFSPSMATIVKEEAILKAKSFLGDKGLKSIAYILGLKTEEQIEALIGSCIEAAIDEERKSKE